MAFKGYYEGIVERPNDWAKAIKASEGLSDIKKTNLEYWEAFKKYAFNKAELKKYLVKEKHIYKGGMISRWETDIVILH